MASYSYPAVFQLCGDGSYYVRFPDIPNAMTQGFSLDEALYMAAEVLRICLEEISARGDVFPAASEVSKTQLPNDAFVRKIRAEIKEKSNV